MTDTPTDEGNTFYGLVTIKGVTYREAYEILNGMEASPEVREDPPSDWGISAPRRNRLLRRDTVESTLTEMHRSGRRPRPETIAKEMGLGSLPGAFGEDE